MSGPDSTSSLPVWRAGGARAVLTPPVARDPRMRAATADRTRCADYLSEAYATGQLNDDELSARLDAALNAKTLGDLVPLTADLNFGAMTVAVPATSTQIAPVTPPRRRRFARLIAVLVALAVLATGGQVVTRVINGLPQIQVPAAGAPAGVGDLTYTGTVADLPPQISANMGDAHIDLTGIVVDADATLNINTSMGDVSLRLPAGANVVLTYNVSMGEIAFTGGKDTRTGTGINQSGTHTWTPNPGGPVLTINLASNMGSVSVG